MSFGHWKVYAWAMTVRSQAGSKVEKIVSSVKCHLKKRSIVSTLEGGPQSAHWKPVSVKCLSRV